MSNLKGPWISNPETRKHYDQNTGAPLESNTVWIKSDQDISGTIALVSAINNPIAVGQLIAAAPTMLAALKEIAGKLEGFLPDQFGAEYTLAMEAIKKAEGGS